MRVSQADSQRSLLAEICFHYWLQIVAVLLSIAVVLKVWQTQSWGIHAKPLLYGAFGLLSVLASDEVAAVTGRYGWTRAQWWQDPPEVVKWVGALILGVSAFLVLLK